MTKELARWLTEDSHRNFPLYHKSAFLSSKKLHKISEIFIPKFVHFDENKIQHFTQNFVCYFSYF
nr:MAG TPA: hypothetical protein [Caudoviricetes sp.]